VLGAYWTGILEIIFIKILSIEDVHRRRRKTRECTVEAHPRVQRTVRGIKQRNKRKEIK
jgi:hypothetical protein